MINLADREEVLRAEEECFTLSGITWRILGEGHHMITPSNYMSLPALTIENSPTSEPMTPEQLAELQQEREVGGGAVIITFTSARAIMATIAALNTILQPLLAEQRKAENTPQGKKR